MTEREKDFILFLIKGERKGKGRNGLGGGGKKKKLIFMNLPRLYSNHEFFPI